MVDWATAFMKFMKKHKYKDDEVHVKHLHRECERWCHRKPVSTKHVIDYLMVNGWIEVSGASDHWLFRFDKVL